MFLMSEVPLYPEEEMVVEGARACSHCRGGVSLGMWGVVPFGNVGSTRQGVYLTQSIDYLVFIKSIHARNLQLILYYYLS